MCCGYLLRNVVWILPEKGEKVKVSAAFERLTSPPYTPVSRERTGNATRLRSLRGWDQHRRPWLRVPITLVTGGWGARSCTRGDAIL
jgi:hypothetical protein